MNSVSNDPKPTLRWLVKRALHTLAADCMILFNLILLAIGMVAVTVIAIPMIGMRAASSLIFSPVAVISFETLSICALVYLAASWFTASWARRRMGLGGVASFTRALRCWPSCLVLFGLPLIGVITGSLLGLPAIAAVVIALAILAYGIIRGPVIYAQAILGAIGQPCNSNLARSQIPSWLYAKIAGGVAFVLFAFILVSIAWHALMTAIGSSLPSECTAVLGPIGALIIALIAQATSVSLVGAAMSSKTSNFS